MPPKRKQQVKDSASWKLMEHVTRFSNHAWSRQLRSSRSLASAIESALEDGYSEDEVRLAFWCARCVIHDNWLKSAIGDECHLPPEIVLRHDGGINNQTGKPAVRWLDVLLSRADEMATRVVEEVMNSLPEDMRAGERELLTRMKVKLA